MLTWQELGWFALATLAMALTPGPNMIYCVSRTLVQGRGAGLISLAGVLLGFLVHLLAAAFGLTAVLMAVPYAFGVIKTLGAAYLLWLAWQAVRPGGVTPFQPRALPAHSPRVLFQMGFITNVLNPKVAMFGLSFLPQFMDPQRGSVLVQALQLGAVQISASALVNAAMIVTAARAAAFFARSSGWVRAQRYVMGSVLGLLAMRIALLEKK
jgi:threonine/homoserine/homoserine lactone efflux protein